MKKYRRGGRGGLVDVFVYVRSKIVPTSEAEKQYGERSHGSHSMPLCSHALTVSPGKHSSSPSVTRHHQSCRQNRSLEPEESSDQQPDAWRGHIKY